MEDIQERVFSDFEPPATTDGSFIGRKKVAIAQEKHLQMKLEQEILEINQRLKASKTKVTIYSRKGTIQLRATLPLKPGDTNRQGKDKKQYTISLGIPANFDGLKTAEEEAQELGKLIARQTFIWTDKYLGIQAKKKDSTTFREFYEQFEKIYFSTRKRTLKSQNTINHRLFTYKTHFLNDEIINADSIVKKILAVSLPGARDNAILVGRIIADYFKLKINFNSLRLKSEKKPRNIPTDKDIVQNFSSFEKRFKTRKRLRTDFRENWKVFQLTYSLLAIYGLRPREIMNNPDLDWLLSPENKHNTFKVHESNKTGYREVFPFVPEWIELFNIKNIEGIDALRNYSSSWKNAEELHSRVGVVSRNFSKAEIPFKPYDLRHAAAIRAHLQGIPMKAAADNLGHSVEMHTKVYQRWFGLENRRKAFNKAFEEIEEIDKLKDKLSQAHKCIADLKIKLAQCQLKK